MTQTQITKLLYATREQLPELIELLINYSVEQSVSTLIAIGAKLIIITLQYKQMWKE